MNGFLLDTNTISELMRKRPHRGVVAWIAEADEGHLYLSALTIGEIRQGIEGLSAGKRRTALERWLDMGLRVRFAGRTLAIDEPVALRWGILTAQARRRGRPLPTVDGLLAATALHHGLTIVTRNTADFHSTGVAVLNPWNTE